MIETPELLGPGASLVGVISEPGPDQALAEAPAFVLLNAGVTHRVGPNRSSVRLSRALAGLGFTVLRFDFSGLGDSLPRTDDLPLGESLIAEVRQAMDHLARTRGCREFVLGGLCSGATLAFLTAREDERVVGGLLINAQGHLHGTDPETSDRLRAATLSRHSLRMALRSSFRAKNWKRALGGRLQPGRILAMLFAAPLSALCRLRFGRRADGASSVSGEAPFDVQAELSACARRGVRLLHLYCEADEGLDYFRLVLGERLQALATGKNARFEVILGANHTLLMRWSQERMVQIVCDWARGFAVRAAATATATAQADPRESRGTDEQHTRDGRSDRDGA